MSPAKKLARRRSTKAARSLQSLVLKYASVVVRWSLPVMVVATAYLLFGIYSGRLTADVPPRIVSNLQLAGQVLAASAGLSAICLVMLTFDEIAWAVLMGLSGLAYLLGTPFLISNQVRSATSPAAEAIATWGTITGTIIVIVVGIRIVHEIYNQLAFGGLRVKGAAEEEGKLKPAGKAKIARVGPFTPCWETPSCHQAIREMCPAFRARKTCWRFGRGCNCDPGLVESLIRTGGVGASGDSSQRRTQQEYLRSDLQADVPTQRERTIPCAKCAIYMEHQRAKFRFISPILVIGTIVALIVFYRPVLALYSLTITGMAKLASIFSYGDQVDPEVWFDYLNTSTVQVFFLLMLGLLVLSWVLKFVEWAILVKKL